MNTMTKATLKERIYLGLWFQRHKGLSRLRAVRHDGCSGMLKALILNLKQEAEKSPLGTGWGFNVSEAFKPPKQVLYDKSFSGEMQCSPQI